MAPGDMFKRKAFKPGKWSLLLDDDTVILYGERITFRHTHVILEKETCSLVTGWAAGHTESSGQVECFTVQAAGAGETA